MTFYYYFTMTWMLRGFDIKRLLRRFDSQYKNLQSRIFTVTHKESRIKAALTMSNPIQPQLPRIQMTERYSVATNTFKHTKEQPNPVIFRFAKLIQNPLAWSNSILYVYIYIYLVPADAVPNEPQQSEAIGQRQKKVHRQAGRCCLADCCGEEGRKKLRTGRGGSRGSTDN